MLLPLSCVVFISLVFLGYYFDLITFPYWRLQEELPETHHFVLPDKREIAYGIYGAASSIKKPVDTVFYFHGTPSSHHETYLLSAAAQHHGIRIIAPSRPGSGGSTFHKNHTLLDCPADILALANHLNIQRFGIIGVSGGAPYAFACWHRLPRSHLVGLGIVSGIYPVATFGTNGMQLPSRLMLWIAPWLPGLVAWMIDKQLGQAARDDDPRRVEALLVADMQSAPEKDRQAWEAARPEIKRAIVTGLREGVRYGGQGPAWEMRLLGSSWGFELDDLHFERKADLTMWHGDADTHVPLTMAHKAVARLGGLNVDLRVVEGEGHGTLVMNKAEEIMETMKTKMLGTY